MNGALYSILAIPSVREEARAMVSSTTFYSTGVNSYTEDGTHVSTCQVVCGRIVRSEAWYFEDVHRRPSTFDIQAGINVLNIFAIFAGFFFPEEKSQQRKGFFLDYKLKVLF